MRPKAERVNELMVTARAITEPVRARPVVKWAGGKTALLEKLVALLPTDMETYVEPFCGGAALFFWLAGEERVRFKHAILADKNAELINCYQVVQRRLPALIRKLDAHQKRHLDLQPGKRREDDYYELRNQNPAKLGEVARAARLIFLNKTCFNGLWRVNASGIFNVPYGRYANPRILDEDGLEAAHRALRGVMVVERDFQEVTHRLSERDFVYFDPPYVPLSATANFTAYSSPFRAAEQERLVKVFADLQSRGVKAMLSNNDCADTRELYRRWSITVVPMRRAINSDPKKRGDVNELLVTNYDPKEPDLPLRVPPAKAAS